MAKTPIPPSVRAYDYIQQAAAGGRLLMVHADPDKTIRIHMELRREGIEVIGETHGHDWRHLVAWPELAHGEVNPLFLARRRVFDELCRLTGRECGRRPYPLSMVEDGSFSKQNVV